MANPHVFEVTVSNFESDVVVRSQQTAILLDFWADWCGPCKTLKPVLESLAEEYGGAFLLGTVDTEQQPELAQAFQVQSIPFCVMMVDGRPVDGFQGALPEPELRTFLERVGLKPLEAEAGGESAPPKPLDEARDALARGQWQAVAAILATIDEEDDDAAKAGRIREGLAIFEVDFGADESPAAGPAARGRDLFLDGQFQPAVEAWIESLAADRNWREGLARRAAVMAFEMLAVNDAGQELVRELRGQMATLLY